MRLVIRADATPAIGAGHVMRCLALAESWLAAGGTASVWGRVEIEFARARAEELGVAVRDAESVADAVLLVDTYDQRVRDELSSSGAKRVIVDDMGEAIPAGYDAVWNPNPYGQASLYEGFLGAIIVGQDVVPLSRGLGEWTGGNGGGGAVSFGGGGPPSWLADAVAGVPRLLGTSALLCSGNGLPAAWPQAPMTNPWSALRGADWFMVTASSTLWQAASVGIPVIVTLLVPNQVLAANWARAAMVPVVDLMTPAPADVTAQRLADAVRHAAPLPKLTSGADRVVARLQGLVS